MFLSSVLYLSWLYCARSCNLLFASILPGCTARDTEPSISLWSVLLSVLIVLDEIKSLTICPIICSGCVVLSVTSYLPYHLSWLCCTICYILSYYVSWLCCTISPYLVQYNIMSPPTCLLSALLSVLVLLSDIMSPIICLIIFMSPPVCLIICPLRHHVAFYLPCL